MNEGNIIKKYLKKRGEEIRSVLNKQEEKLSEEDLRQLRVNIKKIRAISKLIKSCDKDFKRKKFLKPYQEVFKQAGKQRELTLQAGMLKKQKAWKTLPHYTQHLTKNIDKRRHDFIALKAINKIQKNQRSKHMYASAENINEKDVQHFIKKQKEKIKVLLHHKHLQAQQAHQLRKRLKELYYLIKVFNPKNQQSKMVNNLQYLLGKWHDKVVLKDHLQHAISSGSVNGSEAKKMEIIAQRTNTESNQLFKEINQEITGIQKNNSL